MIADSVLKIKPASPDPTALRKRLADFSAKADDIAAARKKFEERKRDLAEEINRIDPSDDKAISQLSALRTQVELFARRYRAAHTEAARRRMRSACQVADEFGRGLKAALTTCAESRRRAIEELLTPLFPGERAVLAGTSRWPGAKRESHPLCCGCSCWLRM